MPTDDQIRQALRRRADASSLPEGLWERIEGRSGLAGGGRARRVGVALFALAVATASFVYLTQAFRPNPETQPVDEVVYEVQEFPLDARLGRLLVAEGAVWIAGDGQVVRVDPTTGEVLAEISVHLEEGGQYGSVGEVKPNSGLAFGDGLIWVTAEPFFAAIDPATNQVATSIIFESGVTNIEWDNGRILYGGSGEGLGVTRLLDPYTAESEDLNYIGSGPDAHVLATEHWFWSGGRGLGRVSRDGVEGQDFKGIGRVDAMAEAGGYLWVTGGDNRLWQIDVSYQSAPAPTHVESGDAVISERALDGPAAVAAGGGRLWLYVGSDLSLPNPDPGVIMELDPGTGDVLGTSIRLPYPGPVEMSVGSDGLPWLTMKSNDVLVSIRSSIAKRGMFFPTWNPEGAVPTGIVQGVLVEDDRCLFVEANDRRTLVVWEEGLGFEGDALLNTAGSPIAQLGEMIHGGGGYFSDQAHMEDLAGEAIPDRCVPSGSEGFALIYEVAAGRFD